MSAEARKKWWFHMPSSFPRDSLLWKQMGKAVRLYLYFRSFANRESGILLRKYETIAEHLGISPKTAKRWMDTLRKHGYIKTTRLSHGFKIEITDYKSIIKNRSDKSDQSVSAQFIKEKPSSLDTSDQSKESIKESIKEIRQMFEEDWERYPRPAGNKENAFLSYQKIIGPDPDQLRPLFLKKMDAYVASVYDTKYLQHGERFFREWQTIEVDSMAKQTSGSKFKTQADHNSASSGETVF